MLTVFFVAALVSQAVATLYVTSPTASTTCTANQPCLLSWNDDGNLPPLSQIGSCSVGLYVGSQTNQFFLQALPDVVVSQQASATFQVPPNVGGNSNLYFVRFTSHNLTEGQYPWEGFSAKFTLTGMIGTFNDTELSAMTGATSAAGPTSTASIPSSSSGPASGNSIVHSVTSQLTTPTSSSSKVTATTSKGAAIPAFGSSSHVVALTAVIVSAFFAAAIF